ncbi:hypothetical protein D3C78_983780 [compost metagenome]
MNNIIRDGQMLEEMPLLHIALAAALLLSWISVLFVGKIAQKPGDLLRIFELLGQRIGISRTHNRRFLARIVAVVPLIYRYGRLDLPCLSRCDNLVVSCLEPRIAADLVSRRPPLLLIMIKIWMRQLPQRLERSQYSTCAVPIGGKLQHRLLVASRHDPLMDAYRRPNLLLSVSLQYEAGRRYNGKQRLPAFEQLLHNDALPAVCTVVHNHRIDDLVPGIARLP